MSCQRIEECTEMWLLIFYLTKPDPDAGQITRQIGWVFFFLMEVFNFSKISYSQAFSGWVCQGLLYSRACECVASHHLIESCQSPSRGDSTVCLCQLLAGP